MIICPIQFGVINNPLAIGVSPWIITQINVQIRYDAVVVITMAILRASVSTIFGRRDFLGNQSIFTPTNLLMHQIATISLPQPAVIA
jgi:hypothetical protein